MRAEHHPKTMTAAKPKRTFAAVIEEATDDQDQSNDIADTVATGASRGELQHVQT
jgi:hypothetical protein